MIPFVSLARSHSGNYAGVRRYEANPHIVKGLGAEIFWRDVFYEIPEFIENFGGIDRFFLLDGLPNQVQEVVLSINGARGAQGNCDGV